MAEPLDVGVTYLPAETGIHMWLEPRPARAARDLAAIRAAGVTTVRLHLAWDAFMPSHRGVDRLRLRDLDAVLEAARGLGLGCELVLFAQSHGGCIQLPGYAVDPRRPRPGVRVLTDGAERPGGPRDQYADPLMLEAAELWLRTLLDSFANHPAVAGWDLGHDPATTARPRRIAELAAWAELHGTAVRRRGDRVRLTLGADDLLTARGVRLAAVAAHVDALGLLVDPRRLVPFADSDAVDPPLVASLLRLAGRLAAAGETAPPAIHVVTGLAVDHNPEAPPPVAPPPARPGLPATAPAWDVVPLTPPEGARITDELLGRLAEAGAAGLTATSWTVGGERTLAAPPWDRRPSLARHGLAEPGGELREHGARWAALAAREPAREALLPWPSRLDAEDWYASLPESARELAAAARTELAGEV